MELSILIDNITNPALLFFILGIISVQIKSDLTIPKNSAKFISIYLLISIGFKGGQELSHSGLNEEILSSIVLAITLALVMPVVVFFVLKHKFSIENAGAIAASYGSVSAVTFVTATSFLELEKESFGGHMVAMMALMEVPAIVVGTLLIKKYKTSKMNQSLGKSLIHSITNGSVILIIGSLIIGILASEKQAEGIKPFTTDIFKGFLAVFLLDMGITSGKQLHVLTKKGIFPFAFSAITPFVGGTLALLLSSLITDSIGNQLLFSVLGASASYIAVPAAMRNIAPNANPSLYLPMALGITFPINVIIGIPFYFSLAQMIK